MDDNKPYGSMIPSPYTAPEFGNQQSDPASNWPGSPADKQRAMNLLQQKSRNVLISKESSDWLNNYMEWVDRSLPPIPWR